MKRIKLSAVFVVTVILLLLFGLSLVNGQGATSVQANTDGVDEIVVIGEDGYVYAYNIEGKQVYKSPEGGWSYIATADFNNDGDYEIVAVSDSKLIKVYDPQIVGTEFTYQATYSPNDDCNDGTDITKVGVGDFWNDGQPDIALLVSVDEKKINDIYRGRSCVVIYDLPNTSPSVQRLFTLTDWQDFAVGDYDGDGDDDFGFIYWNGGYESGYRNWVELRKGNNPNELLNGDSDASQVSNSEWFDIVSGNFYTDNGSKEEWAGSQNTGDNVVVNRWTGSSVSKIWSLGTAFNYLAAADFRQEGKDQLAMLRRDGSILQFASGGTVWSRITGIGGVWTNLGAGQLDTEKDINGNPTYYKEAVAIKSNLIRIYLRPQAGSGATSTYLDCNIDNNCFEDFQLSGDIKSELAVADLGITFQVKTPFEISTFNIAKTAELSQTIAGSTFYVSGSDETDWAAYVIPDPDSLFLKEVLKVDPDLRMSLPAARGGTYNGIAGLEALAADIDWLTLTNAANGSIGTVITGTTPSTITVAFSNTYPGSPLYEKGAHKAAIFIARSDLTEIYAIDVLVLVDPNKVYLPLIRK